MRAEGQKIRKQKENEAKSGERVDAAAQAEVSAIGPGGTAPELQHARNLRGDLAGDPRLLTALDAGVAGLERGNAADAEQQRIDNMASGTDESPRRLRIDISQ